MREARAYYKSATGAPLPEMGHGLWCSIRIENDNGVLELHSATAQQIAALRAVGLWL